MDFGQTLARRWSALRVPVAGRLIQRYALHAGGSVKGLQIWFVLATVPALVVSLLASFDSDGGSALALSSALLLTGIGTSFVWHFVFAVMRPRKLDSGWFMHGWLFCLLLPLNTSPLLVILGASFGVVIGALIVGGTGRYVVSPALLGAVFLMLSYPAAFTEAGAQSTWQQLLASGSQVPEGWTTTFLLQNGIGVGTASAAACAVGVLILYAVGAASLRIVAGALVGAALAAELFAVGYGDGVSALPTHWHWIVGYFPFCLAFIATDPSPAAATRAGRWFYGALFGVLVVTLRVLNPEHPEATLAACLLASLFSPLIDQCCVRFALKRWRLRKAHGR